MTSQSSSEFISIIRERLISAEVVDIKIGYSTTIEVYNKNKDYYYLRIGNSEVFINGDCYKVSSENIESKLVLAKLYQEKITSLEIDGNGNLLINFGINGKRTITKSAPDYEAWEMDGPNYFKIVCALGGEIVCWY